jgi:RNA polymerase sigma factor (sigma-70 family)
MVRDAHLAEDLVQETMIAAHESLDGFEPGGNFGRWLRGIARNKALMHWRSEKRHPLLVDSRVVEGIDEVFDGLDRNPAEIDWWESRKLALRDCVALLSGHGSRPYCLQGLLSEHRGNQCYEGKNRLGNGSLQAMLRMHRWNAVVG